MDNSTTARVDLQRLQILNDRLCQTLEALNQVRMSAHNVSLGQGMNPAAFGWNTPYTNPYAQSSIWGTPMHTTGWPQTLSAWGTPGYGVPSYGIPGYGVPSFGVPAFGAGIGTPSFTGGINPLHATAANFSPRSTPFVQPTMW